MKLDYNKGIRYLFIISFILLSLIPPFYYIHGYLSGDESGFMFIGDRINHGSILYKDFIDNKPPGIFYLNALIFSIFGKSFYASRIVLFVVNALSALIIYFFAKNQWDEHIGQLSSILFLIGVYNPAIEGFFIYTEQYMVFFGLLGIFVFFKFRHMRYLVPVGVLLGISTLFKQSGILFYLVLLVYNLSGLIKTENRTKFFLNKIIISSLLLLIGFLIPIFITLVFFYREGVAYEFFYWTFLYYESGKYGAVFDIIRLQRPINSLVIISIPAFISFIYLIYNSATKKLQLDDLFLVYWLLIFCSTLTIRQYAQYFIPILLPACILASITLARLPIFKSKRNFISKEGFINIFIIIFLIGMIYHTGVTYQPMLKSNYKPLKLDDEIMISDFVISHTEPNQRILAIPYDPSIYFLSGRNPPVNYLIYKVLNLSDEDDNLISSINKNDVPYIIFRVDKKGEFTQKLWNFVAKNYAYEGTIGKYEIYKKIGIHN
jgi:4-amino-4-deoxy-L-arabinose transferase-like glycosyltransferase